MFIVRASALATVIFCISAAPAAALQFLQDDWQAGDVSGSTTSALSGWTGYDSDNGDVVIMSTGFRSLQDAARTWDQTDDGTGISGFNHPNAVFSTASVVNTGANAYLSLLVQEGATARTTFLPSERGDMGVAYQPTTDRYFLFGGIESSGVFRSEIYRYHPDQNSLTLLPYDINFTSRSGVAAVYYPGSSPGPDPGDSDRIFLLGGSTATQRFGQIVAYIPNSGFAVTKSAALSPARTLVAAAYHPTKDRIFAFGGSDGASFLDAAVSYDVGGDTLVTLSTPLPTACAGAAAAYHPIRDRIYLFGGESSSGDLTQILEFDQDASTWTVMTSQLPSGRRKLAAVYNPATARIYLFGGTSAGGALDEILEFDPEADTLTVRPAALPSARGGMAGALDEKWNQIYLFGASSGTAADFDEILFHTMYASGTYTSMIFDTVNVSTLTALDYTPVTQSTDVVDMNIGFRAGNVSTPDTTWTNAGKFTFVPNGGTLSPFTAGGLQRYIQYRATFTTTNVSTGPVMHDISIGYIQTAATATLRSSAIDTTNNLTVLQQVSWQGTFNESTTAQFQLRTAPDNGSGQPDTANWSAWLGPTSVDDYYANAGGADPIHVQHSDGIDDQWFQYRATVVSQSTVTAPAISTVSIRFNYQPSSPTSLSLTADSTWQITAQWTDDSINEDEFVVSTGIPPPFWTPLSPVNAINTTDQGGVGDPYSYAITGLSVNTPYQIGVRAHIRPPEDLYSFYADTPTARVLYTHARPPLDPGSSAIDISSITIFWNRNGNPSHTIYEVSYSSDNFSAYFSTPIAFTDTFTQNATHLLNLDPATTYYFRIQAQNGDAVETAFTTVVSTPTRPDDLTGLTTTAVNVTSISWSWDSAGPAASYRVFSATSDEIIADLNVTTFDQTGLSSNTLNGVYVQPYTLNGSPGPSAPLTLYTLAARPVTLISDAVSTTTVSIDWDSAGSSTATVFEVSYSTDDFATHFSTAISFGSGWIYSTAVVSGLDAGTTHYFRVRARNGDSVDTHFSNIIATPTVPGPLGAPSGSALGVSSLTWTWTNTAGPAVHGYRVYRASDGVFLGQTASPTFSEIALKPNIEHGLIVSALDPTGEGELSPSATVYTHAAVPAGTDITDVFVSSAIIVWSANGNPDGTQYEVETTTDGVNYAVHGTVSTATVKPIDLLGGVTHYFRVRARNGDAVLSDFDVAVSTYIFGNPPVYPSGLTAVPIGNSRIHITWDISPTTTVVQYTLYMGSGSLAIDYTVLFASTTNDTTSYVTSPLTPYTTYHFGLRAKDESGQEEDNTFVVASARALPDIDIPIAVIRSPPAGKRITGNHFTVEAELLDGSPDAGSVRFQYKQSASPNWVDISTAGDRHPNPAVETPYAIHWSVVLLPDGHYDVRAVAEDLDGIPDPFPPSVRVLVGVSDPDIDERTRAGGGYVKRVKVHKGSALSLSMADDDSNIVLKVSFSSGAINTEETYLRVESDPTAPDVPKDYSSPQIFHNILLENGQTTLLDGRRATITYSQLDQDGDNRVDDTHVRSDNLRLYYYDTGSASWSTDYPSTISPAGGLTVTALPDHFTLFGLLSPAAVNLDAIRVYPVPFKPNGANPDEGKAYTSGDPTSGVVFDNLTSSSKIKIYTVTGALVWESETDHFGGLVRWDGNTGDGREAASGVYFAVITSSGHDPVVRKLVVIR